MKKITSFSVDHDTIVPGFYISRIDGDIITFDLRTRTPNAGDYMDNLTMHSVEHMLATLLRNSEDSERVIYFGPMGCQTGFYLLMRDTAPADAFALLCKCLADAIAYMILVSSVPAQRTQIEFTISLAADGHDAVICRYKLSDI